MAITLGCDPCHRAGLEITRIFEVFREVETMTSNAVIPSQRVTFAAPERILVATDLNDSDYLIPYVVAQAKVSNSHVTLVHAIIPSNSFPVEAGAVPYGDRESIDKDARELLLNMAHQIKAHGIACDVDLQHGFAAGAFLDFLTCRAAGGVGGDRAWRACFRG